MFATPIAQACVNYSGDWVIRESEDGTHGAFRYRINQKDCASMEMAQLNEDYTTKTFAIFEIPLVIRNDVEMEEGPGVQFEYFTFNTLGFFVRGYDQYIRSAEGNKFYSKRQQIWRMHSSGEMMFIQSDEINSDGSTESRTSTAYRIR